MRNSGIEEAVQCIWDHYSESLSLTEMAESARLSRFYFTRLFRTVTGITPGRFLAAVRIHHAKRLLLSTHLSVADVSCMVGYSSLGSFTSCFTANVGISPGRFRRLSGGGAPSLSDSGGAPRTKLGAIAGTVSLPDGHGNARVFVGAFKTPIVQHPAAASRIVDVPATRPTCYYLPDVPNGTWFVHAVAMARETIAGPEAGFTPLVGGLGPTTVDARSVTSVPIRLRHRLPTDPPVLLALPDLTPPVVYDDVGCPAIASRQVSARS